MIGMLLNKYLVHTSMSQLQPDCFVQELKDRLGVGEVGTFYILNMLVVPVDNERVIGPLTKDEVKNRRERYATKMDGFPAGVRQLVPFVVLSCIDERVFELYQI